MKKTFLLIILGTILNNCNQPINCTSFKVGKFIYADESFPDKITRNDTLQIEINPNTGIEIHTSIDWKSECEYELTYIKILNGEDYLKDLIGQKINVTIIQTTSKGYIGQVSSKRLDRKVEFVKIN